MDASAYEELSNPQAIAGCNFVKELNNPGGAKVLDMGSGTGHVTKYIADIVGSDGVVLGIDPDAERVEIAQEKYKDTDHLQFQVGNSVTGFPHDNEPYYDFHVSTAAFHWFPPDQKKLYIQKTYESLKPGGKLAIVCLDEICPDKKDQYEAMTMYPLSGDELRKLFEDVGLFTNVLVKQSTGPYHFKTYEIFKRWIKASVHCELDDVHPDLKTVVDKMCIFHDDGRVTMNVKHNSIIA